MRGMRARSAGNQVGNMRNRGGNAANHCWNVGNSEKKEDDLGNRGDNAGN